MFRFEQKLTLNKELDEVLDPERSEFPGMPFKLSVSTMLG